jgi:uncharacterized membrane protein HdeD (DUF308 family)
MTNTAVAEHNSDTTGLEPPASPPLLWKTPQVSGVLTLIVGALVLGWPETSILVTATLFGVLLLVATDSNTVATTETRSIEITGM